jgi:RNA polymerase sigma factor (sigma-70 family)
MADSQMYNSEPQCWKAFLQGNHSAFEQLFKSNYNALYQYALRFHHHDYLAHECVQQLFCQLWVSRERLSLVENVKAYLFKALRTYLHKESAYQQRLLGLENHRQAVTFSPEDIMVEDESDAYRKTIVADTLNVLPQRQREVIYLKYYENMTYPEIADVLEINYQSVVNLVFRAIKRLRQEDQLRRIAAFSPAFPLTALLAYWLV